jgi:BirA family biotin operon repressor/biotin-[acetyl-CoA-carboxylase] ligase
MVLFFSFIKYLLSRAKIAFTLYHKTLFTGKQLFELNVIASTNNYAAELIARGLAHDGALVQALYQTQGRGQRDNNWKSAKGLNLLLSYIFFPKALTVSDQFVMNAAFTLAVCKCLKAEFGLDAKAKWPNDIMVENKKIAGLLIENSIKGSQIVSVIVGIGLNVNQFDFDDLHNATSIGLETGSIITLSDCRDKLSNYIEAAYLQLINKRESELLAAINDRLWGKGSWQKFDSQEGVSEYYIVALLADGRLKVSDANGCELLLQYGNYRLMIS